MDVVGGLWHLLNFFAASAGIGFFASLIAKLLWRRQLAAAALWRLWLRSSASAALAATAGLAVFGRDGKMATYGAMALACALALWWAGFRDAARRG